MIVPASGGIGAFHYALKMGISMLFLSMSRDPEQGAEVGLSYAFLSHTVQLVIILIMGLISIPMLAKNKKKQPIRLLFVVYISLNSNPCSANSFSACCL